jgi:hypothetical protein
MYKGKSPSRCILCGHWHNGELYGCDNCNSKVDKLMESGLGFDQAHDKLKEEIEKRVSSYNKETLDNFFAKF